MDEAVIKYYRSLLREGFKHAGSFENPSLILDSVGEGIRICGRATGHMRVFVIISNGRIEDLKYLCNCDPTANVAVEMLCDLARGRTLEEASRMTEDLFGIGGGKNEDLRKRGQGLLELLRKGLNKYHE